ncbi:MAG: GerMN domain-containing protein [Candidatus Acidiferrales bacterium]
MSRNLKITLGILVGAVLLGLLSLHGLHQSVKQLAEAPESDEQARLAVVAPPISTPTDVNTTAHIFWRSASVADRLDPVDISIPLSADTSVRAKQLLHTLIVGAPTEDQKTLPEDITVLGFYVLPDGTGIADFSDGLSSETPSGILSESLAVTSITRTLESNVSALRRLKILIHGQEVDTLAGHVDLTGFFDMHPAPGTPSAAAGASTPN